MQQAQMTQNDDQRVITGQNGNQSIAPTFNPGFAPTVHVVVQPEGIRNGNDIGMRRRNTGLGITRIVIGILCIIMQVIAMVGNTYLCDIGDGIWCGIFFLITGSFGLSAGCTGQKWQNVTHAVLSIVSASVFAPIMLIISVADIAESTSYYYWYATTAAIAAKSILLCLAVAEIILDIIVAGFFCKTCCSCYSNGVTQNGGFIYPNMQQPQGNMIQMPTIANNAGLMYIQPGVGQSIMYQPPTNREQTSLTYGNQGYNSDISLPTKQF